MRTIKFRGKNKFNGEWVYGDLVQCMSDDIKIVNSNRPKEISYRIIDIQSETVGQFTGLLDKNGKEIYDGDVIKGKHETTHLIQYNEKEGSFFAYSLPISEFSARGHFTQDWINKYSKIVIGNIHDNPELLKNND